MKTYEYSAAVTSSSARYPIYDGDTVRLDIDCGFGIWKRNTVCRLYGIDKTEMRGADRESGTKSRDALREILSTEEKVRIRTHKDKTVKYGRYLVANFVPVTLEPMLSKINSIKEKASDIVLDIEGVRSVNVNLLMVMLGLANNY